MNNKGNHQGYNNDNSWSGQNVRKSYDYYNQNNRGGDYHDGGNKIEQRMQNLRFDNGSSGNRGNNADQQQQQQQHNKEPKKMTWATIASQPAKPQVNTTSTTIKKKGPGMPPPPMIPGKHNMELNDGWDTPKNAPLVPPSPPIITAPPIDLSLDKQNSNFDGEPNWPTPGQAVSQAKDQPAGANQNPNSNNNNNHSNNSQGPPQQNNHKYDKYDRYENNNKYDRYEKYDRYDNSNKYDRYDNSNNYHGRQQYNNHHQNSGPNQHHYNSSNYNDYQKPYHSHPHQMPTAPPQQQKYDQTPITRSIPAPPPQQQVPPSASPLSAGTEFNKLNKSDENILETLRGKNQYNPSELDLSLVDNARFFVIKSYSEDDIHRSIKYEIWCSTEHGNKRLDQAYREREKENGVIYLFFSVNSSGHFCGVAQMMTSVDYNSNSSVWSQDKWKGSFRVKWVYVKDVPNTQLRHIRLENNENKPVTNSRDTQEVPNQHGIQILKIIHSYKHTTSIFDDFTHYEKRQEEEDSRRNETNDGGYQKPMTLPASHHSTHNRENNNRQQYERDREYNGGGSGFDRGNFNNGSSFNKYGSGGGYNNDFKPFNNGRGSYHNKRNDFRNNDRNDRNGDQSGGIYRAKDFQQNDDFGNRSGGYRSDRGGSRGRGGFRPMNHNN